MSAAAATTGGGEGAGSGGVTEGDGSRSINTNEGSTASPSNGEPFSRYTSILPILLDVSLFIFIAMSALRYHVNVDAYIIKGMLMLLTSSTVTRINPIANVMFIIFLFYIKIC